MAMQDLLRRERVRRAIPRLLLSRNNRMQADLVDHLLIPAKSAWPAVMMMANFGQETKPIPVIARSARRAWRK